jgi:hypothetical protein
LRVPPDRITACDLDSDGVEFCAKEFGIEPLISKPDLTEVSFPRNYDLIWVGSLLTHLPVPTCVNVLDVLTSILEPAGLLVFTTHGESCLNNLGVYGPQFVDSGQVVRDHVDRFGAYFMSYPGQTNYGVTFLERRFVHQLASEQFASKIKSVYDVQRGWDNHQDVWAWQSTKSAN